MMLSPLSDGRLLIVLQIDHSRVAGAADPARRLPRGLQRAAAAPGDRPQDAGEAYRATPKALPSGRGAQGHFRLRYDVTDSKGA